MGVRELMKGLCEAVEDPEEESFLLFTTSIPSSNLGFVDSKAQDLEIAINGRDVVIKQSPGLLSSNLTGGTTGAVLWKVTPVFAEWISDTKNCLFSNGLLSSTSVVLELGTGISGLVALALGPKVQRYVATDQNYVLKTLRANIEQNSLKARSKDKAAAGNIDVLELDWETSRVDQLPTIIPDLQQSNSHPGGLDLIIACDCIYNEALVPSFVRTCVELCSLREAASLVDDQASSHDWRPTICIVAQQLRSDTVFEEWLRAFHLQFQVCRMPDDLLSSGLKEGNGFVVHIGILR